MSNVKPTPRTSQTQRVPVRKGMEDRPIHDQAQKIIAKFGGDGPFAQAMGMSPNVAYRWYTARPYGCDGLVPNSAVARVTAAAERLGIVLTPEDWAPNRITYPTTSPAVQDKEN